MPVYAPLLQSIVCGRCRTHLLKSYKDKGITKHTCRCGLKIRTVLECTYCKNKFLNLPYLIRKANYCSRECYRRGNDKRLLRICKSCGEQFYADHSLVQKGFGFYCSRDCWFKLFEQQRKQVICRQCFKNFSVYQAVYKKHPKFCSKKCKDDFNRDYIIKVCKTCKKEFEIPRWEVNKGKGSFCSRRCHRLFSGESSIETIIRLQLEKMSESFEQEVKFGKYHVDFYLPNRKLVLECDGEYWHKTEKARQRDRKKDKFLQAQGYKVLRLAEQDIREQKYEQLKF